MSLYDLEQELAEIDKALEDNGGELTPEIEARMDALNLTVVEKVDNYVRWRRNVEAELNALRTEAERWGKRVASTANRLAFVNECIKRLLEAKKADRLAGTLHEVRWHRNSQPSVNVVNEDDLPTEFWKGNPKPDLTKIREYLERDESVPGAKLIWGKHVRVK